MQITQINSYNVNRYRNNKISSVNFKSSKDALVSPKVIGMMKSNIKKVLFYEQLNDVNKYITPIIQQNIKSYPAGATLKMIMVPAVQLRELLGEKGKNYRLSALEGICVVITDKDDEPEKCNKIYETTVCLVPDPVPNLNLSEFI